MPNPWSVMRRAALLVLALLFASCGEKTAPPKIEVVKNVSRVTIIFRHGDVSGFEKDFRDILNRFEALHPGVKIQDESMPWDTGNQHQIYSVNLQNRSDAFDVMSLDIIWLAEFGRAGWIRDLSGDWPLEERKDFLDSTLQAAAYRDRTYAVPWFTDAGLLYYRKDLLAKHGLKVPETWAELAAGAKKVMEAEKSRKLAGFVWQGKRYEGMVCNALEFIQSNGVRILDEKGRWAADPARTRAALDLMRSLLYKDKVSPLTVLAGDEEMARHIFGSGQAVFMRNWPYAYAIYNKPDSEIKGKFAVAPLPGFKRGTSAPTLGGWFLAVNTHSKYPKEAFEFIRFMTSAGIQKEMFLKLAYLPTRRSLYRDRGLLAMSPQLKVFEAILKSARPRPITPEYAELTGILQAEISAALAEIKTTEQAVQSIQERVKSALDAGP